MAQVRILLVEDHKLMRVGLKSLFEEHKELEVISEDSEIARNRKLQNFSSGCCTDGHRASGYEWY